MMPDRPIFNPKSSDKGLLQHTNFLIRTKMGKRAPDPNASKSTSGVGVSRKEGLTVEALN